jgi:hypothetical protein
MLIDECRKQSILSLNTWEYVELIKKHYDSDEYSGQVLDIDWLSGDEQTGEHESETPLSAFLHYVDSGVCPPTELIMAMGHCFQYYIACRGKEELEHIFFGKRQKGVGNYSARKVASECYKMIWFEEQLQHSPNISASSDLKNKKDTIESLAEKWLSKFIPEEERPDIENFLRNYRRWKKKYGFKLSEQDN